MSKLPVNKLPVNKLPVDTLFKLDIQRATFVNQDIVVFPEDVKVPDNLNDVVKFLFGRSAEVKWECTNNNCILVRIIRANYILDNVTTSQADFIIKEHSGCT